MSAVSDPAGRARHWDEAYETRSASGVSWYQSDPTVSLELIRSLRVEPTTSVIDIGGGASPLVDRLVTAGFVNVTVLDISDTALRIGRARLGEAAPVAWRARICCCGDQPADTVFGTTGPCSTS